MMPKLSQESRSKLVGVHPDLMRVVEHAIAITKQDFKVLEGVRSIEQCYINYGKGRTSDQCKAAHVPMRYAQPNMPKVTWLKNPLASRHVLQNDGFGHAVDLVPYPVDWSDAKKFDAIADAMLTAAKALGVKVRWGADWDRDGVRRERGETDSPHFEI
jgi:peptidoglycan L-alanyl-D-glutamate endopeptidase CwlK